MLNYVKLIRGRTRCPRRLKNHPWEKIGLKLLFIAKYKAIAKTLVSFTYKTRVSTYIFE